MDERELEGDELLGRVVDELRALPPADEAAVRRIVAAAGVAGRGGDDDAEAATPPARVLRRLPWGLGAGIAAAAGLAGFLLGGRVDGEPARPAGPTTAAVAESAAVPAVPAALASSEGASSSELAPRRTQFVLEAPDARRVVLVGDFNGWDRTLTPLVRDAGGLWTATIALTPGRHTYAFIVDDSTLTLDPRAPRTTDPDLGTRASVVLVGGGSR